MNDIQAFGATKSKRALAEDVAYFCINEMMPRMKTLDVCIHLDKLPEADGYCLAVTDREFQLEIEKTLTEDDFITAVCHEMVHVKQFARGETKDINRFTKQWQGTEYLSAYSTIDEYMALPWEKEAYELQEVLCNSYKLFKSKQKKNLKKMKKSVYKR
jgi:hypothetical protein